MLRKVYKAEEKGEDAIKALPSFDSYVSEVRKLWGRATPLPSYPASLSYAAEINANKPATGGSQSSNTGNTGNNGIDFDF
jgi:hypothetical protein